MPLTATTSRPNQWFPTGYVADATNNRLQLSIGSGGLLPEVTTAEANPATGGDIRKLLFGLWEGLYNKWALKLDELPSAEESVKIFFNRSTTFTSATSIERRYTIRVEVAPLSLDVQAEDVSLGALPVSLYDPDTAGAGEGLPLPAGFEP